MHICKELTVQDICGAYVISIVSSKETVVIHLNDTSYYLWRTLLPKESFTVNDAVDLLEKEYDVDHATALANCKDLIENWLKIGIVIE